MKIKLTVIFYILISCVTLCHCGKPEESDYELDPERSSEFNKNIKLSVSGPFYHDSISRRFSIPPPDSGYNMKDAFILNVKNYDKEIGVFIDATPFLLVYPDSSVLYTYAGYGATEKGYLTTFIKPHKDKKFYKTEIPPTTEKDFYFFSNFDSHTDSIGFFFSLYSERKYELLLSKSKAYVVEDGALYKEIKY